MPIIEQANIHHQEAEVHFPTLTESRRSELEAELPQLKKELSKLKGQLVVAKNKIGRPVRDEDSSDRGRARKYRIEIVNIAQQITQLEQVIFLTELSLSSGIDRRKYLYIQGVNLPERADDPTIIGPDPEEAKELKDIPESELRDYSNNSVLRLLLGVTPVLAPTGGQLVDALSQQSIVVEQVRDSVVEQEGSQPTFEPTAMPTNVASAYGEVMVQGTRLQLDRLVELQGENEENLRGILNANENERIFQVALPEQFSNLKKQIYRVVGAQDSFVIVNLETGESEAISELELSDPDILLDRLGAVRVERVVTPAQVTVSSNANLRSEPSTSGRILGGATAGEVLTVRQVTNTPSDWVAVTTSNGQEAFISTTVLEQPLNLVPVTELGDWEFPEEAYLPTAEELRRAEQAAELGIDLTSGVFSLFEEVQTDGEDYISEGQNRDSRVSSAFRPSVEVRPMVDDESAYTVHSILGVRIVRTEKYIVDGQELVRVYFSVPFSNGTQLNAYGDIIGTGAFDPNAFDTSKNYMLDIAQERFNDGQTRDEEYWLKRGERNPRFSAEVFAARKAVEQAVGHGILPTDIDAISSIVNAQGQGLDATEEYFAGLIDSIK